MSEITKITKELLQDLYWNKGLSTYKIASSLGVDRGYIRSRMKTLGVPTRNLSRAMMGLKKSKKHCDNISKANTGKVGLDKNHHWKGGRTKCNGYMFVKCLGHPEANKDGYIIEHRLIMEKQISRPLKEEEIVHHINANRTDNRIENLMLFPNNSAHLRFHRMMRKKSGKQVGLSRQKMTSPRDSTVESEPAQKTVNLRPLSIERVEVVRPCNPFGQPKKEVKKG